MRLLRERETSCVESGKALEPFNKASIQIFRGMPDCQGGEHITAADTNCTLETDQNQEKKHSKLTAACRDMEISEKKSSFVNCFFGGFR